MNVTDEEIRAYFDKFLDSLKETADELAEAALIAGEGRVENDC